MTSPHDTQGTRGATEAGGAHGSGGTEGVTPPLRHRNLPLLLLQARERLLAHFRPALKAEGVTEQQWRIVRALLEQGPLEPRQIVGLCAISSPSLAGVLARMDDLGLVRRVRLGHDARRVLVSLTPRSRALARRLAPLIEETYAAIEQRIGQRFTEDVYAMVDTLLAVLDPADPAEPE